MEEKHALAIDIGGTKIAICAINTHGEAVCDGEQHLIDASKAPREQIAAFEPFIGDMIARSEKQICGIGVSVAGSVDPESENVIFVPNLHWHDIGLKKTLEQRFGIPVFVNQDTRTAALGEHQWGTARGVDDLLWVTIGTGVGAALILDGKLRNGLHGYSGWIGHSIVDEKHGAMCSCGRRGCLETLISGSGIIRQAKEAIARGEGAWIESAAEGKKVYAEAVMRAARAGDHAAAQIIENAVNEFAKALGLVVNVLDLTLVILGGGVVKYSPELVDLVKAAIPPYIVGKEVLRDLQIVPESLPNAAMYGAGAMVFERLDEKMTGRKGKSNG